MHSPLFLENQPDRRHKKGSSQQMVPSQRFMLEEEEGESGEDHEGDHLLQHLELHQRERPSVQVAANSIRRDLKHIFEEGNAPGACNESIGDTGELHAGCPGRPCSSSLSLGRRSPGETGDLSGDRG